MKRYVSILIMIMVLLVISCGSTINKKVRNQIDIKEPASAIEKRSKEQIEVAETAVDISPEIEGEMDHIIDLSNLNIEDAEKIKKMQTSITKTEKDLVDEKTAHKKTKESLEKAHKNTLVRVMSWLAAAGVLAFAVGIGMIFFKFYTMKQFCWMGAMIAGGGALVGGLAIFTIIYLNQIAITIGVMIGIVVIIIIVKGIAMSKSDKKNHDSQKVVGELIDTFEDSREVAKGKHSPETRIAVAQHKIQKDM